MKLVERIETNSRHFYQILIAWFTFFITLNWASLGWIAATEVNKRDADLLKCAALTFTFQNLLGIFICGYCIVHFRKVAKRLNDLVVILNIPNLSGEDFPARAYIVSIYTMIAAIVPIPIVWILVAFSPSQQATS